MGEGLEMCVCPKTQLFWGGLKMLKLGDSCNFLSVLFCCQHPPQPLHPPTHTHPPPVPRAGGAWLDVLIWPHGPVLNHTAPPLAGPLIALFCRRTQFHSVQVRRLSSTLRNRPRAPQLQFIIAANRSRGGS